MEYKPGDLKSVYAGKGKYDVRHLKHCNNTVMKPIEIHLKEDAAIGEKPGFLLVHKYFNQVAMGEVSLEMLNRAMNELGYDIVKKETK